MKGITNLVLIASVLLMLLVLAIDLSIAAESSSPSSSSSSSSQNKSSPGSSHTSTATQARQSTAASVLGTIGALVPGLITNVAPLVLLLGASALLMPSLGMSAMGLLRESRRSSNEQLLPNMGLPSAFAQYARPLQTSPQDIYYFTKRSFPSLMSSFNSASLAYGVQELLERVLKAIDNADKRYN